MLHQQQRLLVATGARPRAQDELHLLPLVLRQRLRQQPFELQELTGRWVLEEPSEEEQGEEAA